MARKNEYLHRMIDEARAAGHTITIEHRGEPNAKGTVYWIACSCGYRSTSRRSSSAVVSTLAWHAGQAAGEADGRAARVNGGVSLRSEPHPAL